MWGGRRFNPISKRSELTTMKFVRESGLYPDIPIPEVYASDLTFTNPVGAPYVLMELIKGRHLNDLYNAEKGSSGLDALSLEDQMIVVDQLARLQVSLSKPVPFDKIGSLTDSGQVGELFNIMNTCLGGPYRSLLDMWYSMLEKHLLVALRKWDRLETDELAKSMWGGTPQQLSRIVHQLSALIPHFIPPEPYLRLVLYHPDLALRNIIWDPEDLTKIVGVIDWSGSQITPLITSAKFPGDLLTYGDDPLTRPGHPDEGWQTVPHDWTSFGDVSAWPQVFRSSHQPIDQTIRASEMIRRYYLRQHFSLCYARRRSEIDRNLEELSLFEDAPYYLKFNEILSAGTVGWFQFEKWVSETYWRVKMAPKVAGPALMMGPNHYGASIERLVCDLGMFEQEATVGDDRDDKY
jgi:hypothetical protein